MTETGNYQIHVQQPTVPHYRVPFFDALAARHGNALRVSASRKVFDGPVSADVARDYLDLNHECSTLLNGRAFWQQGMLPHTQTSTGDVAVICANPRYLSTFKFAALARRRGMGVVWWGHGWSPTSRQWAIRIRSVLMQSVDAVLLYSDAEVAEWRQRLPNSIEIFGAQNAIDQSRSAEQRIAWTTERLAQFRHEHNLEGRKLLLFCGRLRTRPYTGVDLLLQALAKLKRIDPGYLAVVIGEGEDQQRLHTLSQQLGVDNHVRWLGAQFEEASLAPWFLSSLCFTYPGPIGLSILHAMGYGLPVITHNNRRRHNPEIVVLRDGWNGLMFDDENAVSLAEQIQKLATDTQLRQQLSDNAMTTAHREYTLETMVNRFSAAAECARNRVHERRSQKTIVLNHTR